MAQRRPRTLVVVLVVAVLVAAVAVPLAIVRWRERQEREDLRRAATAFATAWRGGTLDRLAYASTGTGPRPAGTEVARQAAALTAALTVAAKDLPAAVDVVAVGEPRQGTASARLAVRWALGGGTAWTYETSAPLRRAGDRWAVAWSPAVVHPALRPGLALSADRTPAPRGRVLGARDQVLVEEREVVRVGIDPGRTKDPRATARAVAAVVDVDAADLARRVSAAKAGTVVDVITLRRPAYDEVRSRLRPVPGTVFTEASLALAPTPTFARALLGSVGPATSEIVKASKGRVRAGDLTGLSGLQNTYDARLAGRAGLTVRVVRAGGTGAGADADAAGADAPAVPAEPLLTRAPVAGQDVRVTLDRRVQEAAEAALEAAPKPAGLVALRPSTGEVLAVANGGPNAAGYNRALVGQYPPGSTFKVVTTLALLRAGVTPATPVACPPTLTVQGRVIRNAEGEALGTVPFRTDFAESCNTAFVGSASKIDGDELRAAARDLGYDATAALGVPAFAGSVPPTDDPLEHAVAMIGQGRVLASPLNVATASASVAAGERVVPRLVTTPAPADEGPGAAALAGGTASSLRALMRAVVTDGTGTALRGVPGPPVSGKTGTAEFGSGDPPPTHAWFTGFQGDLAFAVVVENGGFGAKAAAPLAASFLTRLR